MCYYGYEKSPAVKVKDMFDVLLDKACVSPLRYCYLLARIILAVYLYHYVFIYNIYSILG